MGAVKQMLLRQGEDIRLELEDLLEIVEKHIAITGSISTGQFSQIADLFSTYGKIYPEDDMADFGQMLIIAITNGRQVYDFKQERAARIADGR